MCKVLHTADLHFSINTDKLVEVVRTTDFLLERAAIERPDVIILAGDSVDEYDGRIRLDSECARAAISFVERAADIAPVIIIRGTKSHDRESPAIFSHLRAKFPILVACDIKQISLTTDRKFVEDIDHPWVETVASFTLVPSLDKSYLMAADDSSIRSGNMAFKEAVHDLFAGFGIVNDQFTAHDIPTILVTHGMLTGACFSSGQTAIGEDLEFGLNDLHAAKATYTALGHVHKHQVFPGNVVYCGSPGRLNFGEAEDKGFVIAEFSDAECVDVRFEQTPARRFCFGEVPEYTDAQDVYARANTLAAGCRGADVRFRLQLPEECRADVDRDRLEQIFLLAGANKVKLEISIIPKQRSRSEGISRVDSLPEKVLRWGAVVGESIPDSVLALASVIEGITAEELLV
jgi:exonuclease SbcD